MGEGIKLKTMHNLLFRRFNRRMIVDFESDFRDVVGDHDSGNDVDIVNCRRVVMDVEIADDGGGRVLRVLGLG